MAGRRQQGGSFNLVVGVVMLVVGLMALWFIFKSLLSILAGLAPILLIITLILDRSVVFDYVKGMVNRLKNDTLMGVAQVAGTFLLFPFVCVYLFAKAMLLRKVGKIKSQMETERQGEYAEYEELEDDDILDLKDIEEVVQSPKATPKPNNKYDDLFNE